MLNDFIALVMKKAKEYVDSTDTKFDDVAYAGLEKFLLDHGFLTDVHEEMQANGLVVTKTDTESVGS